MGERENGRKGDGVPQVLMEYRRGLLGRVFLHVMPVWLAVFAYFAVQHMVSRKIVTLASWLLFSSLVMLLVCAIRFMLTRSVVEFRCTDEGIAVRTVIGRRPMILWGSLRCFSRTRAHPPFSDAGWLISEGHPCYVVPDMPAPQMRQLEEVIRNHSNAEVSKP